MKRPFATLASAALLACAFTTPSLAGESKDIVDTAVAAGSFKTLVTAVKAAGLVGTLKSKGPFTVFAPTDAAFAKLPKGTIAKLLKDKKALSGILTYHVVAGRLNAKAVLGRKSLPTVNGQSAAIALKKGKPFIDGAQIIKTDIHCSNGIIHVIDAVILPKKAVKTSRYFPLSDEQPYLYRKTTKYKGLMAARNKTEMLLRRPTIKGRAMVVRDSEGEYQEFVMRGKAPAMRGQSMVAQGFTQRYDPPLIMFPSKARIGKTETFASIIRHKTRQGTQTGAIERVVTVLGIEDVRTPAGLFRGCLKFRAVSKNRPDIGGSFLATTDETIWLAPGIGEVKSVSKARLGNGTMPFLRATITLELAKPLNGNSPAVSNEAKSRKLY